MGMSKYVEYEEPKAAVSQEETPIICQTDIELVRALSELEDAAYLAVSSGRITLADAQVVVSRVFAEYNTEENK